MESTGELEAVTMCGEIDIKEESVLTDPNWQLFEETEHIFIKEENVKLETLEDPDAHEPLQLKKEESPPQEETISPPDAVHTKKEPELQKEVEASSCGIEPRRFQFQNKNGMIPIGEEDDYSADGSDGLATRAGLAAGKANIVQCTTKAAVFSTHKTGTRCLAYSCATCKKKFAHLQDLEEHKHIDSREFQHSCTVCHKTLKSSSTLKVHLRLHTGERPHRCDVCQKAFTTSGALRAHSRQHTGECPYTCKVCHKVFRSQGTLWSHSRVHTGERPYTVVVVCV
ncbi:zinc finger protein 679-like isoform X6 [Schistocerca serialis cubense]|uniref:zinc finger protein 679-like isoform X6 n=1 Tax=Schistocerca serialis cubense TaxID=2023355 RepID=UPI00214ED652|nr:zinc finger protein 679-like isoform X6 [Schistocerca serialis cubense]